MKKIYVCISIVLLACLTIGCLDDAPSTVTYVEPITSMEDGRDGVVVGVGAPAEMTTFVKQPPDDMMWITPAKVKIGNLYAGARAEWTLRLHNGNNVQTKYAVVVRNPDNTITGYSKSTDTEKSWVIISDQAPVLAPRETRDILIAVDVPLRAKVNSKNWEFWVSAMDAQQKGQIVTELCSRWNVDMR